MADMKKTKQKEQSHIANSVVFVGSTGREENVEKAYKSFDISADLYIDSFL